MLKVLTFMLKKIRHSDPFFCIADSSVDNREKLKDMQV